MQVNKIIDEVIKQVEEGAGLEAIVSSAFPTFNVPSAKWSLFNRIVMALAGTADARGIRQWNQAGRRVKPGSKAFYILAPRFRVVEAKEGENGTEERRVLAGFLAVPVFRVEDTDGELLDYEALDIALPLRNVADALGVSVRGLPLPPGVLGTYDIKVKEILLGSPDTFVFFHELAHAVHDHIMGGLHPGQNWRQEIVAELSAIVLMSVYELPYDRARIEGGRYIRRYASSAGLGPRQACLAVISEVEKVLNFINSFNGGQNDCGQKT